MDFRKAKHNKWLSTVWDCLQNVKEAEQEGMESETKQDSQARM
jgi:hypothetical protein